MGDITSLGMFETGLLADMQATDLDLLQTALAAEGVEDHDLFEAMESRDHFLVAKLLGDEKRSNYLLKARFQVGRLFALREWWKIRVAGNFCPRGPRFWGDGQKFPDRTHVFHHSHPGETPVQLSGSGGKRGHAPSASTYPVFNLKNFEGRPLKEMVEAARHFHDQASYMRPPGFTRFASASQRAEIGEIQSTHRRMALLLGLDENQLPLEEKGGLVRLFHGEKEDVRQHLERLLKTLDLPALRAEVRKINRLGFAAPIDLVSEMKVQDPRHRNEIQNLVGRWFQGEIALAVVSSAELAGGESTLKAISQKERKDVWGELLEMPSFQTVAGNPEVEKNVGTMFYAQTLVEEIARINMTRAHVTDLEGFTGGLKRAMDRLATPYIGEVETKEVFAKLGDEGARAFLGMLRHGTITISRSLIKKYYEYFLRLSQRKTKSRAEDYFPVVVAVPTDALKDGFIDLSRAERIDYYVLKGDAEKLRGLRGAVHPFFPFPDLTHSGIPKTFLMEGPLLIIRNEMEMVEKLVQSEEGAAEREKGDESGFPKGAVDMTRNFHRQPSHHIRQGIDDLERQREAAERRQPDRRSPLHERDRLVIRFLRDGGIPLELKAAMRDLYTAVTGSQVNPLLDSVLGRYDREGTTNLPDLSRELFAGYFLHAPWAWAIMVEEWLKKELVFGFHPAPLEVTEVPRESRKAAWQFAWSATHLMGFSEAQAALILRTAAFSPRGEDSKVGHRRFVSLSRLALPADDGAFEFLRNYKIADDPGGARLRHFLSRLDSRSSEEETRRRFRSAILRSSGTLLPELRRAEKDLIAIAQEIAGSDPVHLWDLHDAVSILTYHLAENLEPEKGAEALHRLAQALRGWWKWNGNGAKREEDPLTREIKALLDPFHLANTLRALAKGFGSELLAPHLIDLLKRQSGNLHTLQYLLVAFHLKERHDQAETRFIQLFREERRWTDLENRHGKIKNDQYLKYALFDLFPTHLAPHTFAMEMERRVARQFADQWMVERVEVIPETWTESVVDFKIHLKDGQTFLVEVKTVFYDGKNFPGLLDSLREQVRKAAWQLKNQYRSGHVPGRQDQIIVYIQTPSSLRLGREEMERLYEKATHAVANDGFQFIGVIRIEQES